jgi:hypothetical protein
MNTVKIAQRFAVKNISVESRGFKWTKENQKPLALQ